MKKKKKWFKYKTKTKFKPPKIHQKFTEKFTMFFTMFFRVSHWSAVVAFSAPPGSIGGGVVENASEAREGNTEIRTHPGRAPREVSQYPPRRRASASKSVSQYPPA